MTVKLEGAVPVCRICGRSLSGSLFLSEDGHQYCCEGCHLNQVEADTVRQPQEDHVQGVAEALVTALDAREHETGMHSKRVACHTLTLARHFTDDPNELLQIYYGSLLHDIGKIAIPDHILLKPGALNAEERAVMKTHPQRGYEILSQLPQLSPAASIVLTHEERFDGKGYPNGLAGTAIPIGARLLAVIDTLDAMTTDRVYRNALSFDAARKEIIGVRGKQFDSRVVEVFLTEEQILRKMVDLKCSVPHSLATSK